MSVLLFNGFLLLSFVVAAMPDVLVLGSEISQIVGWDKMVPSVPKKCQYTKSHSLLTAQCSKLELLDIPSNLDTDIKVSHTAIET